MGTINDLTKENEINLILIKGKVDEQTPLEKDNGIHGIWRSKGLPRITYHDDSGNIREFF